MDTKIYVGILVDRVYRVTKGLIDGEQGCFGFLGFRFSVLEGSG